MNVSIALRDDFSRSMERQSALSVRLEQLRQELVNQQRVKVADLDAFKLKKDRVNVRIALRDTRSTKRTANSVIGASS